MMRIRVEHDTFYQYLQQVELAHHLAYLHPFNNSWQHVLNASLDIYPSPDFQLINLDAFDNMRMFFNFVKPHELLTVKAHCEVEVKPRYELFEPMNTPVWSEVKHAMTYSLDQPYASASEFVWTSTYVPWLRDLHDYAMQSFTRNRPIAEALIELNQRIFQDFTYSPQATEISTPLSEIFNQRLGVCQDFSHVMIGCLRAMGLPAKYVSGYLLTKPAEGQLKMRGADASHAWVSAYCPGAAGGWLELDPTNQTIADEGYVRLAYGRDFGDVSPLRGVIRGGGAHTLQIAVTAEEVVA
jgi:transglutaminase-like putative cysteine protease